MSTHTVTQNQPVADDRPAAEMAAWDPMDEHEHEDAVWELTQLDRHGMLLLVQVGVATLLLAVATGVVTRFS